MNKLISFSWILITLLVSSAFISVEFIDLSLHLRWVIEALTISILIFFTVVQIRNNKITVTEASLPNIESIPIDIHQLINDIFNVSKNDLVPVQTEIQRSKTLLTESIGGIKDNFFFYERNDR